jgi:hypothetical protein
MKRTIFSIIIAAILLLPLSMYSQVVLNLSTGGISDTGTSTEPLKRILISNEKMSQILYQFNAVALQEDETFSGQFQFGIEGFGTNSVLTEPAYLSKMDRFVVPSGYDPVLVIENCNYVELPYRMGPAREHGYDDSISSTSNVQPVTPFNGYFPEAFVSLAEMESYRNTNMQYVAINPIQYNYNQGTVRILTNIVYTIGFKKKSTEQLTPKNKLNIINDSYLGNACINASILDTESDLSSEQAQIKNYLIITVPELLDEVKRFAHWKNITGLKTDIISKESWTSTSIKDSILEYAGSHPNLYYLLLVGDNTQVPGVDGIGFYKEDPNIITDYEYSCIDGDNLSDVYLGRIPVSTSDDCKIVFDKIMRYEKNPYDSELFYKRAAHASYFQIDSNKSLVKESRNFIKTSELCRDIMQNIGKDVKRIYYASDAATPKLYNDETQLPDELLSDTFNWEGNASDIINAIDSGIFYIMHRDHGSPTYWGDPYFSYSNIQQLNNQSLLPVVFSINCDTGKFYADNCFATNFLAKESGGCVSIFAATESSPTIDNDNLAYSICDNIAKSYGTTVNDYLGSSLTLGEILQHGMAYMMTQSSNITRAKYERKIYDCFGDPSMVFLTEPPVSAENVVVEYDDTIKVSTDTNGANINFYDVDSDKLTVFNSNSASYNNSANHKIAVSITGAGLRPVVLDCIDNGILAIQNETILSSRCYTAPTIIIGSNIDTNLPTGIVSFEDGNTIIAGECSIDPETNISKGVELQITPQY